MQRPLRATAVNIRARTSEPVGDAVLPSPVAGSRVVRPLRRYAGNRDLPALHHSLCRFVATFNRAVKDLRIVFFGHVLEAGRAADLATQVHLHLVIWAQRPDRFFGIPSQNYIQQPWHRRTLSDSGTGNDEHVIVKYTGRNDTSVPKSTDEAVELPHTPLKPMPEHLYDAVLGTLRTTLGSRWGRPGDGVNAAIRLIRESVKGLDGIYIATDPSHDQQRGIRIQLWVDHDDLDLMVADDVVSETLRGLGNREILVMCRTFEDDGIHYRFASGTVDVGLVGTIVLVGPYARDVARLARIGSGQPLGFSA